MLLADVSGHGASVSPVAVALRDLMRRNINFIKQTHLVASLNSEFESISATGYQHILFSNPNSLGLQCGASPAAFPGWTYRSMGL